MKDKKKYLINILLFVALITLTFSIVLKNQNIEDIKNALASVDGRYLLIGILAMFVYFSAEALNLKRTLGVLGENVKFFSSLRYVLIGFFFSAITPAASGGQPAQIYFIHKDNHSAAKTTLSLLIMLCSYHIVTISLAIISFIFNVNSMSIPVRVFFIIGVVFSMILLSICLIGIFYKKLSNALINIAVKILRKFKIKNADEIEEKLKNGLEKYNGGAEYIKSNPKTMIITVLITLIQLLAYYSVSYWVYRSFGLTQNSLFKILTLQSVLFLTVCILPLPGSVGASEGVFMEIYSKIYSQEVVGTAMMLYRLLSFYMFVLVASIIVMISILKNKKEKKIKEENRKLLDKESVSE